MVKKKRLFEMVHELEIERIKHEALTVSFTSNEIMKALVMADILESSDILNELILLLIDNITSANLLAPSFKKISEILVLLNSAKKYLDVIE